MRRMATADRRGREVAWFEDGDLWCSDEAVPPSNPAGWYFRPRGAAQQPWIGPFRSDEAAETSAYSGDALRDARRRLEAWAASLDDEAGEESVDDVAEGVQPDEARPVLWRAAEPAVTPTSSVEPAAVEPPAIAASGQLELGFVQAIVDPAPRAPRRRRHGSPSVEQIELPL